MTPELKSKEIHFTCDYNLVLFESLKMPLQTICDNKYTMYFIQVFPIELTQDTWCHWHERIYDFIEGVGAYFLSKIFLAETKWF